MDTKNIKLVLCDVDGTLLSSAHSVDSNTKAQLKRLQAHGIKIGLATGRPLFGVHSLVEELNLDGPCSLFSGALVYNPRTKNALLEYMLDIESVTRIINLAASHKVYLELYTKKEYFVESTNSFTDMHATYLGERAQEISFSELLKQESIVKATLIVSKDRREVLFDIGREIPEVGFGVGYGARHPEIVFANLISKDIVKPNIIQTIAESLSISKSQIMAFGDAESDIPFIENVGFGVAMGNAPAEVKQKARYVGPSVEEGGVGKAIEALFD